MSLTTSMSEQKSLETFLDSKGFVNIPKIPFELRIEFFPGLNPLVYEIRARDFSLLDSLGRVYLDSTATSQEPQSIKNRMYEYRSTHIRGSNHSENSAEAKEADDRNEEARQKIQDFFNAQNYIIGFTSGTTDTSNWIATRFPLEKDDLLIIIEGEHNSQILTARNIAKEAGADIWYAPVSVSEGRLDVSKLKKEVSKRKKGKILLNLVHVSNLTGVINPVKEIKEALGDRVFIYLDMAQSAGHLPINLDDLDVDFGAISSHKMYGPMGVGAIFINKKSERYIGNRISGGSAVKLVSKWFTIYSDPPKRFEPGTQDLEGAIEFGYTIDYLKQIGMNNIEAHDRALGKYFLSELQKIQGVRIYGPKDFEDRTAVITFNIGSYLKKNHDRVAIELDKKGISVRDGCFCTHIEAAKIIGFSTLFHEARAAAMKAGIYSKSSTLPGAVRASFAFYNIIEDAYKAVCAIREIAEKK